MANLASFDLPLISDALETGLATHNSNAEPAPVTVRAARFDDLEGIEDLIEPFVDGGKLLPRTWDELQNLVPTGFVACENERIIGFAALEIYSRKMGEIRSLCVAEGFQGQGVGKKLVQACVDFAAERRVFEVMVVTSSEHFFRNCGFDFTLPGEKKALFLQTRSEP